jgi:hypothetical protein
MVDIMKLNQNTMRKLVLYLIIGVSLTSCSKPKQIYLYFTNNADYDILVFKWYSYPDTNFYFEWGGTKVLANTQYAYGSKNGWDNDIKNNNAEHVLMLFIVHPDTLAKYSFDEISENYLFSKRYDLHLTELEKNGWQVSYP